MKMKMKRWSSFRLVMLHCIASEQLYVDVILGTKRACLMEQSLSCDKSRVTVAYQ